MNLVNSATVLSGNASYLVVTTDGVYAFDDVQVSAEDLSATTYTYDAANQLTAMNVNGTTTNSTYDAWGRMVGKTQGAYAATYAYRFGDKLKAATSSFPGETAFTAYNYDGLGRRRLEQRDNTTATWFRWSGWEECGEYAGTVGSWTIGSLQTGYVPGLATFAGSNPATAEWRYHLTDHLGSVRQLSGQTKAALARYDYAPYGELMRNAGLPLTVGYTGHLWDSAIGQYYAPFRYYNPQTARWNMRDPLGFVDGPNMYAYVVGNPVNYVDPRGLDLVGGIGGAIAGGIGSFVCGNRGMDVVADIAGGFVGGIFSGFGGAILGTAVSAGIRSRFGSGSPSFQSVAAGAAGGVAGSVSSRTLDALKRNIGSWPDKGYENDIFDNIARWVSLNRRSAITRKVFSKSFASFAGAFLGSGVELLINALSGQCK